MEGVDRISSLPNDLAHHIMSLLPMTDAARTAVLSKRWQALWLSFPVHEFDERWFQALGDEEICRNNFCAYLRRSLLHRDFDHMQKLRIITSLPHDYDLKHLVTRCVAKALLQGKVQNLHLKVANPDDPFVCDHYVLPRVIFSSGSCLVSLTLEECELGVYHKVSFPSLKKLHLRLVHATNRQLDKIIRNSPQLEKLRFYLCHGFDTLKVFNPNVRSLIITRCSEVKAFEMDTPSLNYFKCNALHRVLRDDAFDLVNRPDGDCSQIIEFKVPNDNSICSLETLVLSHVKMNNETFESMLSKFPNLKTLKLLFSLFGKMPSSTVLSQLKLVEVRNCRFDAPVEVRAPNLETFVHRGGYRRCELKHLRGWGLCNIKTLSLIGYVALTDKSLEELLSTCILLENLNLKCCGMLDHLKVISSTLKTLAVHACDYIQNGEIHAPQLVYFQYVGKIVEFSSIVASDDLDAELHLETRPYHDIDYAQQIKLKKLLQLFDQSRVLTIISNNIEYVIFPEKKRPLLVFQPHLKKRLKDISFLDILLGIFHVSFCHETLWINLGDTTIELKFQFEGGISRFHDCIQRHLTVVRLENFDGCNNQLKFLTYLLGKAQFLEFMFISFNDENPRQPFDRSEIVNKLQSCPKASQNAQVVFKVNVLQNLLH